MAKRAGSIADENEQFDTRALIRLSTWGIAAVVAVTTTIFAARSELGTKRVHAAVLSITASPADPEPRRGLTARPRKDLIKDGSLRRTELEFLH